MDFEFVILILPCFCPQTDQRPGYPLLQLPEVWEEIAQTAQPESQLLHPGGTAAGLLQVSS